MRIKTFVLPIFLILIGQYAYSQIDSVILEKYYISDSNDATDATGGNLVTGSYTYRIYVDLAPGSKLLKIYGSDNHQLRISSTDIFFNNIARGRTFGWEIRVNRLDENTVALDSWITLGMASESHSGILKSEDINGSIVGGANNDGGSAYIAGGLLINNNPEGGIPIVTADGLVPATTLPVNWLCLLNGMNLSSSTDTSIFSNLQTGRNFITNDFVLSNSGVTGTTAANRVLVAQLTTKGELSFSLNLEVEEKVGDDTRIVKYVAENPLGEEKTNRFLTFPTPPPSPPDCGCMDPDYVEFKKTYECHKQDSCKTLIKYGCMDTLACNFDPTATFNISSMCCYPGRCNNRDIRILCPDIQGNLLIAKLYPNPVAEKLKVEISGGRENGFFISIFDSNGTLQIAEQVEKTDGVSFHEFDVSCLSKGLYLLRIYNDMESVTNTFIKN